VALIAVATLCGARTPLTVSAAATGPSTWVQSSYEDFRAGELVSVALDGDGDLRLAPEMDLLGDTPEAYVWAVAEAPDGSVFAAAGTDGRVYRFAAAARDAEPTVFFDTEGTVHAITVGPDEHLYVAASPGGDIWRLPLAGVEGTPAPFVSTGAQYVWSLLVDAAGTLYAGTGDGGEVHRVQADGTRDVLYDSGEMHVTALALDADGNVLAGTSDNGHLYRISPAGDVFVLFDAPMKQITGIVPTDEGVYFSALEQGAGAGDSPSEGDGGAAITGSNGEAGHGAVYLLHEDGYVEQLWGSDATSPFALAAATRGVVVGTGGEGRLLHVDTAARATVLGDVDAAQITALSSGGDDIIVGTSNLGRVYRLGTAYRARGEFVSQVKDTATTSRWGRVRWRGSVPAGTSIELSTRSGNTAEPNETWSDWSAPYSDATGSPIGSPAARFVQWKAELRGADAGVTPVLQWVELVYVQRNLRPEVDAFTVHPAGVIYRRNSSFEDGLPIGRLPAPVREALALQQGRDAAASGGGASFLGQAYFLPGSQTFTWEASDPNGDQVTFALAYRGESEAAWKPMTARLTETQYLWDTTTVPDGLYRVRLLASDAPSNPRGQELEGTGTSQLLVVDNTAPRIDNLSASSESGVLRVSGTATDETSLIRAMAFAVDGGDWQTVLPADGLLDAGSEEIGFTVVTPEPGEHTIVVKVTDTGFNSGTARVVVTVQ